MFSTVIVPLDGSPHAEAAVPYADDEARRHGAEFVLVRVVNRPEVCVAPGIRGGPAPAVAAWCAAEIDAETRQAERHWLGSGTRTIVEVGDPVTRLLAEAGTVDDPLIVMTTGDAADRAKAPLSEVARRLIVAGVVPFLGVRLPPAHGAAEVSPPIRPTREVAQSA